MLLVEDDADWQRGLSDFFDGDSEIELVACTSDIADCMEVLKREPVDVVIMDIMLHGHVTRGLDAVLDLTIRYPDLKIMMLSSIDGDDNVFNEAFLNGAYDYLFKPDFDQLPAVIAQAMRYPTSKFGERMKKLVFEQKKQLLNEGDIQLLQWIAQGLTQQEIGALKGIGALSVKKRVGRIMERFQWKRSSKELADKCMKWGLLEAGK